MSPYARNFSSLACLIRQQVVFETGSHRSTQLSHRIGKHSSHLAGEEPPSHRRFVCPSARFSDLRLSSLVLPWVSSDLSVKLNTFRTYATAAPPNSPLDLKPAGT
uniref:Uncharacterized protein n=1 Tax=Opuntia streptacantha TaxID=393608 RepID=A0A7C8YSF0_OPUST